MKAALTTACMIPRRSFPFPLTLFPLSPAPAPPHFSLFLFLSHSTYPDSCSTKSAFSSLRRSFPLLKPTQASLSPTYCFLLRLLTFTAVCQPAFPCPPPPPLVPLRSVSSFLFIPSVSHSSLTLFFSFPSSQISFHRTFA